jgi:hypothetical protein
MPIFTVPIHESNDCHVPAGTGTGGQFCSKKSLTSAQIVRPGQLFDIEAATHAGVRTGRRLTRRFLFNPLSREFVLGVATGTVGRDQSHAEALAAAEEAEGEMYAGGDPAQVHQFLLAQGKRYDRYTVHGHVQADLTDGVAGKMAIVIDRVIATKQTPGGYNQEADEVEASDRLAALVRRLANMGATKDTRILSRDLASNWTTLGKDFPKQRKLKRAA